MANNIISQTLNLIFFVTYNCIKATVKFFIPKRKKNLNGRIVLITGGAGDIAQAVAKEFLKNGVAKVVLCDINEVRYCQLDKTINTKIYL